MLIDGFDLRRKPSDLRSVTEQDFPALGTFERRIITHDLELRTDEGKRKIRGYAAVFNQVTDLYWFKEQVAPGAFTKSLSRGDCVKALFNHDANIPLGCSVGGNLRMGQDDIGLWYEIDPLDTSHTRDLLVLLENRVVNKSSFGFRVKKHSVQRFENGDAPLRTLEELDLFDVSPVTYPAYTGTSSQVRSGDDLFGRVASLLEKWDALERARDPQPEPSPAPAEETQPATTSERARVAMLRRRLELLDL